MTLPTAIFFDVFGTLANPGYVDHVMDYRRGGPLEPLELPEAWELLPCFPDVPEGIRRLRGMGIRCVPLSNWPAETVAGFSETNGIEWDNIVSLDAIRVYKTNLAAYAYACATVDARPSECVMVTANRTFGDLEASRTLGMRAVLIRDPLGEFATVTELADSFGQEAKGEM